MAYFLISGKSDKDYHTDVPSQYLKALNCGKTFEWEEVPQPSESTEIKGEWPKQFKCKKTGTVAIRYSEDEPIYFVDNNMLLLTSSEVMIRDILK